MFERIRQAMTRRGNPLDAPWMATRYAREFAEAVSRTNRLGLPGEYLVVPNDCVDLARVMPVVQDYLGQYRENETLGQAFAINVALEALLKQKLGFQFYITLGWLEVGGSVCYHHTEGTLLGLLQDGANGRTPYEVPLHSWLTSPALEILDVTWQTSMAGVTGDASLAGQVIYQSSRENEPDVIYHPTVVGYDFLVAIGVTIPIGAGKP